jgi:hypothetical protein
VLAGLIDVAKLTYDGKKSGLGVEKSGFGRPQVGGMAGVIRMNEEERKIGLRVVG